MIAHMHHIGMVISNTFDVDDVDPAIKAGLDWAVMNCLKQRMLGKMPTMAKIVNGWLMNTDAIGVYGSSQLLSQVGKCGYGWPGSKSTQRFHLSTQECGRCQWPAHEWCLATTMYCTLKERKSHPWKPSGPLQCMMLKASRWPTQLITLPLAGDPER